MGDFVHDLEPYAIPGEGRQIHGADDLATEPLLEESHDEFDHRGIGLRVRDDLATRDDVRGVEKMDAEEVAAKVVAAPRSHRRDRQPRRDGCDDRIRATAPVDPFEELLLERQLLRQRLEDQVGTGDGFREIVVVRPESDEVAHALRLRHRLRALEAFPRLLVVAREERRLDPIRGEQLAAARAHRTVGSEHGDFAHLRGGRRHD
jgi:hypothetical protein